MNRRKISAMLAVALITSQVQTITFAETNNQDIVNEIVSESTNSQDVNEEVNSEDQSAVEESEEKSENSDTENTENTEDVDNNTSNEENTNEGTSTEENMNEGTSNETEEVTNSEENTNKEENTTEDTDKKEELETSKEYKLTGKLEVDLNFSNPIKLKDSSETNIQIKVNGPNGEIGTIALGKDNLKGKVGDLDYTLEALDSKRGSLSEDATELGFYHLTIDKLPVGIYSIEITGTGYATTTISNIEIQNASKRVLVGTSENIIETVSGTESYLGNFLVGDVTNDGLVNQEDYDVLKNAIGSSDVTYDLNRDGKVDITDLTYIHENIDKVKVDAIIEDTDIILNPENVEIEIDETKTTVEGYIKDILADTDTTVKLESKENITPENPINIPIVLDNKTRSESTVEGIVIQAPSENAPATGEILDENGKVIGTFNQDNITTIASRDGNGTATDTIKIDLGKQVAVSKITIKITGSKKNTNLTEIAKVEFLNNVYKEMPKPKMNIPVINSFTSTTQVGQESMTIGWDHETNVTGYEIEVTNLGNNQTLTYKTSKNSLRIEKVEAYGIYRIRIQSTSGEWKSGYKDEQDEYSNETTGATNLTNNVNDKDGVPDNVDTDFNPQAWDSSTGRLTDGTANFGKDSIIEVQVIPETAPEGPEGIKVSGGYRQLQVSWKSHAKAKDYELYYRKVGTKEWFKANDNGTKYVDTDLTNEIPDGAANLEPGVADKEDFIRNTSFTIKDLEDTTTYEIMMTATNHHGTGGLSQVYMGETTNLVPPVTTNYKLINTPNGINELTNNIESVKYNVGYTSDNIDDVVDNDYSTGWTYWNWDTSVYGHNGPIVTFKEEQTIDTITVITRLDVDSWAYTGNIGFFNEETQKWEYKNASVSLSNNKKVITLKLSEPITAKQIQPNFSVYSGGIVTISEIKFYEYDSLQKDVDNLFADDLHLSIKEEVDQDTIDNLRERANTIDEVNNEYHPNQKNLLEEIKRAEDLLNDKLLKDDILTLDSTIHNIGNQNKIGQTNNYQALGVAVKPGDKVTIYIGSNRTDTKFDLVLTQFNAESGSAYEVIQTLSVGKNEIEIPKTKFDMNYEKGGNLYIGLKSGFAENNTFKVRVSGGVEIPHLNVNNIIDDTNKVSEVKDKIRTYITELEAYVKEVPTKYPKEATSLDNAMNVYTYDSETSILNATDIEGERIMLSLAADQVLAGIQKGLEGDLEGQVDRLYNTLLAWEQLMKISYAQQGLLEAPIDLNNNGTIDGNETDYYNANRAPKNRMNIKYQRMFTGAFMYASSHHVGIGYGSIADTMTGVPFKFAEDGTLANANQGQLFGWGISHEIGHVHDIPGLTYVETTNNILALITQTFNDITASRLEGGGYTSIYDKVTSNSVGLASDKFTALGMFWQLHLAYDNDYTYKMLELNTDSNLENDTFFAKLYRVTRTKGIATSEKGYDATAQTFIRRASDAAGKDLREFFAKWGLVASPETDIYLNNQKYDKETRAIYYLNDEARRLRLEAGSDTSKLTMSTDTKVIASFGEGIEDRGYLNKKEVPLTLSVDKDSSKILGYEIIRKESTDAGTKEVVVGFVERDKDGKDGLTNYIDEIDAVNNRTFEYKVKAYDYNLNVTKETTLGTIKVNHDGSIAKSNWVFDTNTRSSEDAVNEESGHGQVQNGSIKKINDGNASTIYTAERATNSNGSVSKEDPYVTIDLGEVKSIIGLKYNPGQETKKFSLKNFFSRSSETPYSPIEEYEVYVSADGVEWNKAHSGKFEKNTENKIYFNETGSDLNTSLWAYQAQYVKLVAKGASAISIAEIDILGPVGDNIEIGSDSGNKVYENGIGKLKADYTFADGQFIPKDSIIITGEYTGDPAFNVPLVLNEEDENLSDIANVLLFAEIPEGSELGAVAKGTWLYYITPEEQKTANITGSKIKAQLYRYNKLDEEDRPVGQRLVSDTFYYEFNKDSLPEIELTSSNAKTLSNDSIEVIKIDNDMIKTVYNNRK